MTSHTYSSFCCTFYGIHLHTLSCPDEAAFERTKSALRALRVLLEENGN